MLSPLYSTLRRAVCVVLLLAAQAWQLEAVSGAARDGAVHHESASAAAAHAGMGTGEHGHEDGLPPAQHRHGSQHQHGTLADHCTHAHGFATVGVFHFSIGSHVVAHPVVESTFSLSTSPADLFHPPRA